MKMLCQLLKREPLYILSDSSKTARIETKFIPVNPTRIIFR